MDATAPLTSINSLASSVSAELEHLGAISFFESMASGDASGSGSGQHRPPEQSASSSTRPTRARSVTARPELPPLPSPFTAYTYTHGAYPASHLPPMQAGSSNPLGGPSTPYPPPHPSAPFMLPTGLPHPAAAMAAYPPWMYGVAPPPGTYGIPPPGYPQYPPVPPGADMHTGASSSHHPSHQPPATSGESPSSGSQQQEPHEETAIVEDKRRRNTAASARFRLKKKARTLNLERTVSDLEGRATDLEKEASELRSENAFLKNLIMQRATRRRAVANLDQQEGPSRLEGGESDDDEESSEDEPPPPPPKKGKKGRRKASDAE